MSYKRYLDPMTDYSVSNAEIKLRSMLTKSGYPPQTQVHFCLQETIPDLYYESVNFAVYLDGPPHLKQRRELKDLELRDKLRRRYSCAIRSYNYVKNTIRELQPIHNNIIDNIRGLRRIKK